MKAILLIAHGSRNNDANQHIRSLTESLCPKPDKYDLIECAFLELADPDIPTGISNLIEMGVKKISILPYFLAPGNHVAKDITEIVSRTSLPEEMSIRILPYFGAAERLDELILNHIEQHIFS